MIIYAEASAVVSWLLDEGGAPSVAFEMNRATRVVTSTLTSLECVQALRRARAAGRVTAAGEITFLRELDTSEQSWSAYDITQDVIERAKTPVGDLLLRTLDAIHVATCSLIADTVGPVAMLSLDRRVRESAQAAGFSVLPPDL